MVTRMYAIGARGHMLPEKILKILCSFVRFGVYLGNTCLFKKGKRKIKEQRQQYTYKLK